LRTGPRIFLARTGTATAQPAIDVRSLHAKIGELTLENDFLEGALTKAGLLKRKAMIDREHDLSITKQAAALNISRGRVYYLSRPVSASDLELMRRLDGCIYSSPSPAHACCEACWLPRGARSAAGA
jgi:hypothetical protein